MKRTSGILRMRVSSEGKDVKENHQGFPCELNHPAAADKSGFAGLDAKKKRRPQDSASFWHAMRDLPLRGINFESRYQ